MEHVIRSWAGCWAATPASTLANYLHCRQVVPLSLDATELSDLRAIRLRMDAARGAGGGGGQAGGAPPPITADSPLALLQEYFRVSLRKGVGEGPCSWQYIVVVVLWRMHVQLLLL